MQKIMKKERAITLIALIVTIILLLILAAISINTLSSNGLFNKAKEAKEKWQNAQETENSLLGEYENSINTLGIARSSLPSQILYPNGTKDNPPTMTTGQRIVIDNPYPGHNVYTEVEVLYDGYWGTPGWMNNNSNQTYGICACQYRSNIDDKIVIRSGSNCILDSGSALNQQPFLLNSKVTSTPYRLIIICLD